MSLFKWDDGFNVHVRDLDEQHRALVGYVNDLYEAITERRSEEVLSGLMKALMQYAELHFAAEERLMHEHDYPEYLAHKREHDRLTSKVRDFQKEFASKRGAISLSLLLFLKQWVSNHILGCDRKYSPYFRDRGLA